MKADKFKTIIVACIGLLLAWGLATMCKTIEQSIAMAVVVALLFIAGGFGMSIKVPEYPRTEFNMQVAIVSMLILLSVVDFVYTFFDFSIAALVIPNGIIALVSALIVRGIHNSKV